MIQRGKASNCDKMKVLILIFVTIISIKSSEALNCTLEGYDLKNLTKNYWSIESTVCSSTHPKCFFLFSMCLTPLPSLYMCANKTEACQIESNFTSHINGYSNPVLLAVQPGRLELWYKSNPSLTIAFVCDPKKNVLTSDNALLSVLHASKAYKPSAQSSDDITLEVPYSGACHTAPTPVTPGMGPGSKMMLVLMMGGIIYFGVGCVYRHSQGARGIEMIPHFWFWTNLPSYIVDGCIFVVRLVTCQSQPRPPVDDFSSPSTPSTRAYETL